MSVSSEVFTLYYPTGEATLPYFLDLQHGSGQLRRIFVHEGRYIAMQEYVLIIPAEYGLHRYPGLGMFLLHDDQGLHIGWEVADA